MEDIINVAVVGAGIMGHGITQVFAQAGYDVVMMDIAKPFLQKGMVSIRANLERAVAKGETLKEEAEAVLARIKTTMDLEAVREADFVVEAVVEKLNVKRDVFIRLDRICPSHSILVTNTSSISLSEIASVIKRRDKLVGMHWWNPPHLMPFIEVVKGAETSDETVQITRELAIRLGKVPVICKDNPGYLGMRIQAAVVIESMRILEEGLATDEDIDTAVVLTLGLRLPVMGPLRIVDLGGVDTFLYSYEYLYEKLGVRFEVPTILKRKVEEGKLGLKTGEGFYRYTPEDAEKITKKRDTWIINRAREMLKQKSFM